MAEPDLQPVLTPQWTLPVTPSLFWILSITISTCLSLANLKRRPQSKSKHLQPLSSLFLSFRGKILEPSAAFMSPWPPLSLFSSLWSSVCPHHSPKLLDWLPMASQLLNPMGASRSYFWEPLTLLTVRPLTNLRGLQLSTLPRVSSYLSTPSQDFLGIFLGFSSRSPSFDPTNNHWAV